MTDSAGGGLCCRRALVAIAPQRALKAIGAVLVRLPPPRNVGPTCWVMSPTSHEVGRQMVRPKAIRSVVCGSGEPGVRDPNEPPPAKSDG